MPCMYMCSVCELTYMYMHVSAHTEQYVFYAMCVNTIDSHITINKITIATLSSTNSRATVISTNEAISVNKGTLFNYSSPTALTSDVVNSRQRRH